MAPGDARVEAGDEVVHGGAVGLAKVLAARAVCAASESGTMP